MRSIVNIFALVTLLHLTECGDTVDCSGRNVFRTSKCCKIPSPVQSELAKLENRLHGLKLEDPNSPLGLCKNTEIILKEVKFIKDGEIDETEVGKFIDMTVEDEDWKPVLKAVVKECRNSVKARLPEIIKRARAEQKKECNVEWEPFVVCVVVQAFQNCPASKWTDDKMCTAEKQWVSVCRQNVDFIEDL